MPRRRREELPLHGRRADDAMRRRHITIGLSFLPFVFAIAVLAIVLSTRTETIYIQNAEDTASIDDIQEAGGDTEPEVPIIESGSSTSTLASPVGSTGPSQRPFGTNQTNKEEEQEQQQQQQSSMLFLGELITTSLPTGAVEQITNSPSASSTTNIFDSTTTTSSTTATATATASSEISDELITTSLPTGAVEQITNSPSVSSITDIFDSTTTTSKASTTTTATATASSEISGELNSTLSTGIVEQGIISSTSATSMASDSTTTTAKITSSTVTLTVATEHSIATSISTISSTGETAGVTQSMLPADETTEQSTASATILSNDVIESIFSVMSGVVNSTSSPVSTEQSNNATLPTKVSSTEVPDESSSTLPTNTTTSSTTVTTTTSIDLFPYPLPDIRYKPFSQLDESSQTVAQSQLGYTPVSWNVHGFDPIEEKRWRQLDFDEQDGALQLGFDRDTWDCSIDHYASYSWDELSEVRDVRRNMRILGWTREEWGYENPTYEKWWHQLTNDEKLAAYEICYFEDNWNPIDMNYNPSYFPFAVPEFRFVPWDQLPYETKQTARNMMNYNETGWNSLRSRYVDVERESFYSMGSNEMKGARMLGFSPSQWDCHISHYDGYFMEILYGSTELALETLGWTQNCWDFGSCEPASEDKDWNELTPTERGAATTLCYFNETWDEEPVTQWFDSEKGVNTAVSADGEIPEGINMTIFSAYWGDGQMSSRSPTRDVRGRRRSHRLRST